MRSGIFIATLFLAVGIRPLAGQGGPRSSGTPIHAGEECPAGTTEIRPLHCLAPRNPPPSILDYRPKSTLVTPVHLVPRAKFPAVDFHGHPQDLIRSKEGLDSLARALDRLNVRMMISADNRSGDGLRQVLAVVNAHPAMKNRVRILAGIDFRNVGPGWAQPAVAQLDADIRAGAVGVGEISKALGLFTKKADGTRLQLDDPDLDPIWAECAKLHIPVFIHTGDPSQFFQPHDLSNERWLEMALFDGRNYPPDRFPTVDELVKERNNLFRKHPDVTFVMAHMGWQANNLAALDSLFTAMPNVNTEVGAVLYDIGRQPRGAHDFFVKWQDRILFGKDAFEPGEYPYYWRVFETGDEYFDYYRGYHAFWKLYGISLPDSVLKKVYYQNALRLMRISSAGWP